MDDMTDAGGINFGFSAFMSEDGLLDDEQNAYGMLSTDYSPLGPLDPVIDDNMAGFGYGLTRLSSQPDSPNALLQAPVPDLPIQGHEGMPSYPIQSPRVALPPELPSQQSPAPGVWMPPTPTHSTLALVPPRASEEVQVAGLPGVAQHQVAEPVSAANSSADSRPDTLSLRFDAASDRKNKRDINIIDGKWETVMLERYVVELQLARKDKRAVTWTGCLTCSLSLDLHWNDSDRQSKVDITTPSQADLDSMGITREQHAHREWQNFRPRVETLVLQQVNPEGKRQRKRKYVLPSSSLVHQGAFQDLEIQLKTCETGPPVLQVQLWVVPTLYVVPIRSSNPELHLTWRLSVRPSPSDAPLILSAVLPLEVVAKATAQKQLAKKRKQSRNSNSTLLRTLSDVALKQPPGDAT